FDQRIADADIIPESACGAVCPRTQFRVESGSCVCYIGSRSSPRFYGADRPVAIRDRNCFVHRQFAGDDRGPGRITEIARHDGNPDRWIDVWKFYECDRGRIKLFQFGRATSEIHILVDGKSWKPVVGFGWNTG